MNPSDFECETEEEHEADDVSTTERRSYTFDPYGPTRQQIDMTRRDVSSYGESDSDIARTRNHNRIVQSHTESDNEEYVIERLQRRKRRACSDWEDNYNLIDLLQ